MITTVSPAEALEAADWALRHCAPLTLDAAGEHALAARLRALPAVVDSPSAKAAWSAAITTADALPQGLASCACLDAAEAVIAAYRCHDATDGAGTAALAAYAVVQGDVAAATAAGCVSSALAAGVADDQVRWVAGGTPPAIVRELFALAVA